MLCTKNKSGIFMVCYSLQKKFGPYLPLIIPGSSEFNAELIGLSKRYLREHSSDMLCLTKWDKFFKVMPHSMGQYQMVFKQMLQQCRYTKF